MADRVLGINGSHDYFTLRPSDGGYSVKVEMWSRGTFGVELELNVGDARAFAAALAEVADEAVASRG